MRWKWAGAKIGCNLGPAPSQMSTPSGHSCGRAGAYQQPLGSYMIGAEGGPLLQRIKYYEMIAAGARHFMVYNLRPLLHQHRFVAPALRYLQSSGGDHLIVLDAL